MFVQHSKSINMDLKQKSIAIIDKNPYILKSLPLLLHGCFGKVTAFENTSELISASNNDRYDVVMLDIKYACCSDQKEADVDFGFLKQILRQQPGLIVLVMTRPEDVELAVQAVSEGAADFVLKPWNFEKLIHNIRQLFYIKQLEKELVQLKRLASGKQVHDSLNLHDIEKRHIEGALFAYDGNMTHTARQLGITRATLYAKIKKYGIQAHNHEQ